MKIKYHEIRYDAMVDPPNAEGHNRIAFVANIDPVMLAHSRGVVKLMERARIESEVKAFCRKHNVRITAEKWSEGEVEVDV